jgi:hypothetical protein
LPDGGDALVEERYVEFEWHPGLSVQQKQRSVASLHQAAGESGISSILEVSTKSESALGRSLSAFNLTLGGGGAEAFPVEAAFQGSKVFERGGPYRDMYGLSGRKIKRDERLKDSGRLMGFDFVGDAWGLEPKTAFYDWLYVTALSQHPELAAEVGRYAAFSDIEFNPKKSINCQARSVALFVSLRERNLLEKALSGKDAFMRLLDGGVPGTLFST